MKKLFKPASLLFYFFMIVVFFFAGVYYAGITGAAEGQGLAGGAIVLGYGVITAFIALLVSFFIAYYTPREVIVRGNQVLGVIFLIFIAITAYRIIMRDGAQSASEPTSQLTPKSSAPTAIAPPVDRPLPNQESELGLGFFTPDFYNRQVLYFYGMPNLEKPVSEHLPVDSLLFQQSDGHQYQITYAPPWLVPEHLKMDYEILHFKILSLNRDFIQIDVNKTNNRFAYVDRHAGTISYWPDFLLNVHSVEFPENRIQTVRARPLNYAGQVTLDFEFMKPIQIQNDWMEVELQDGDFQKIGKGWIQWRDEEKLLIEYSLLS
ncbi:MAG: hypothetical protein RI575_17070 [Balneolaceae bacterium]|nr:hypothetical protein [Balneolaceae bacterium]MDR9410006.1 hypothetical protein [Balneolaceae bacterium]